MASGAGENSDASERICRICWGEEGPTPDERLVSHCKCAGSLKWTHARCLAHWQETQLAQHNYVKARRCEICKQLYRDGSPGSSAGTRWLYVKHMVSRCGQEVLEQLRSGSWLTLVYRAWKLYMLGASLLGAAKAGAAGLRAGFEASWLLVLDQMRTLPELLLLLRELLGTPCAELVWCQAWACFTFVLFSEVLYTTALGVTVGTIGGFARGYLVGLYAPVKVAVHGMMSVLRSWRGVAKAAGSVLRMPWAALRGVTAIAARSLAIM